jgi:hypothetical protein
MDKHGLKSLKAIDLEGKYERAVKGTIRAQECRGRMKEVTIGESSENV